MWGFEKKKLRKIRRRIFEHGKYDFRGGEGGKYLEKEDIFLWMKRKRRKIFGEGFLQRKNKARLIIGEGKYLFSGVEGRPRRKRREIFGEGKYIFFAEENKNGEGKGEKYLEKENTYFAEEKNEER